MGQCAPCLVRLMADFAKRGHVNSGCVGDANHAARASDHNPDASGYAHAQDIHEKSDHDMQPYVDFIMANPALVPVKYLIYEGRLYYPRDGARPRGSYPYTGPNAHAAHLHVSIFSDAHFWAGDWHVAEAYQENDMPLNDADLAAIEGLIAKVVGERTDGPDGILQRVIRIEEKVGTLGEGQDATTGTLKVTGELHVES